jgi:hypothetical protein
MHASTRSSFEHVSVTGRVCVCVCV